MFPESENGGQLSKSERRMEPFYRKKSIPPHLCTRVARPPSCRSQVSLYHSPDWISSHARLTLTLFPLSSPLWSNFGSKGSAIAGSWTVAKKGSLRIFARPEDYSSAMLFRAGVEECFRSECMGRDTWFVRLNYFNFLCSSSIDVLLKYIYLERKLHQNNSASYGRLSNNSFEKFNFHSQMWDRWFTIKLKRACEI